MTDDQEFNKRYRAKVEAEIAEANSVRARYQAVLDRWWSDKFGPHVPDAVSDYSPVHRACQELDDRQAEADRAYARRFARGW
jgi:hypothetical protein